MAIFSMFFPEEDSVIVPIVLAHKVAAQIICLVDIDVFNFEIMEGIAARV